MKVKLPLPFPNNTEKEKSIQLGEKVSFVATFKKELKAKDDWRICLFELVINPEYYPVNSKKELIGNKRNFIAKGVVCPKYPKEILELTGEWVFSKKDNDFQFLIQLAVPSVPKTPVEVAEFIQRSVKGIGPVLAKKIMDFCNGDLEVAGQDATILAASIKGLSERRAKLLVSTIEEVSATSSLTKLLNSVVDPLIVRRLVNAYGRDAYKTVSENPYSTINVIGFEAADKIALAIDFQPKKPARVEAAALFAIMQIRLKRCSIIVSKKEHYAKMLELLNLNVPKGAISLEIMESAIYELRQKEIIAVTNEYFYLREDWKMEKELSKLIFALGQTKSNEQESAKFCAAFNKWKTEHPTIRLAEKQSDAVYSAANLFSVVTGGPGTGKTTVLKAIMETYQSSYPDSPITLMAPTGLAAKRMTESCGRKAKTIHKALGLTPADTSSGFVSTNDEKLHGGLIIVDEFSMVGIHLANFLLTAIEIQPDTRIVFVGDTDQLPPVTPGSVLRDLIECGKVHVTRLNKNFRQEAGSVIADIALKINSGNISKIRYEKDCLFKQANSDDEILKLIVEEFQKSIKQYGLAETYVITPTHKSDKDPLSSNSLNKLLQNIVNPINNGNEVSVGIWKFRVGDRVINKKNSDDVINGDIGNIKEMIPEDIGVSLIIEFSDTTVTFPPERLQHLELAYAITIHSSQGCEFQSVITPISPNHKAMMTRNLVYTDITRAKTQMTLIGDAQVMETALLNCKSYRNSDLLCRRIAALES